MTIENNQQEPDLGLIRVLYGNALKLISMERRRARRIDQVYRMMARHNLQAGVVDWLANPFIQTALSILERFSANYRIKEAVKLLREAGAASSEEGRRRPDRQRQRRELLRRPAGRALRSILMVRLRLQQHQDQG